VVVARVGHDRDLEQGEQSDELAQDGSQTHLVKTSSSFLQPGSTANYECSRITHILT
jgi:hypothetical protein